MVYTRNSKIGFGKYKGKTIKEIWGLDPGYINWALENVNGFEIDKQELISKSTSKKVLTKNYCYKGYIEEFLSVDKAKWLKVMKNNFTQTYDLELSIEQINAWEDCFDNLKIVLNDIRWNGYYIIFEYRLPHEGGRRPDVIILSNDAVCILEFKMKSKVVEADKDQLKAYARDLSEYHVESNNKRIIPVLVPTMLPFICEDREGIKICTPNALVSVLEKELGGPVRYETNSWLNSKYEPLPTIVDAAKMFMNKEPLPSIKKVNSTGVPNAIRFLKTVSKLAKEKKEHVLALVTGVPGAGKTFLGLNFVYDKNEASNNVNTVYLSGNGPLIKVLTDALKSRVFVKDLHREMDEFFKIGNREFNKNIVVFDEGQRIWDEERISSRYKINGKTEADMMIEMVDENTEWSLLIVLVGEGQEINKGENDGINHWNKAISKSKNKWKVVCPQKLEENFSEESLDKYKYRYLLDLTVSLRTHLAGGVSTFINNIITEDFKAARNLVTNIYNQGFSMFVTRDLEAAKRYCNDRYYEQDTKRYGLMASSKAKNLNGYVNNSFNATKEVNVGWWYNRGKGELGSCCNLTDIVTEFACQGLEVDMPIICWGDDMKLINGRWQKYMYLEAANSPNNLYRINSYRVLLTRGRDGFIIFIPPNSNQLDEVYDLFVKTLGIKVLNDERLLD